MANRTKLIQIHQLPQKVLMNQFLLQLRILIRSYLATFIHFSLDDNL